MIYCGVDEQTEWWNFMEMPLDGATVDQARFYHLYGFSTGFGSGAVNPFEPPPPHPQTHLFPLIQTVNQPRAELNGPMATVLFDRAGGLLEVANRVLYAPNATTARNDWVQAASFRGGPTMSSLTTAIYGGRIYLSAFDYGLKSIPVPQIKSLRPILAAPGGKNLVKAACGGDIEHAADFTPLPEVPAPGESWFDPGPDPGPGDDRTLPLAPSLGDRLFRIRTTLGDTTPRAGLIRLSGDQSGGWNLVTPGWVVSPNAPQVRRFRGWVLDGSRERLTPNKTMRLTAAFDDDDGSTPFRFGGPLAYSCDDRWSPYTQIGVEQIAVGKGLGIRVRANDITSDDAGPPPIPDHREANYEYFLVAEALDGNGSLPYPIAPEMEGQDERLTVGGFSLPTHAPWSFRVAGMVPEGNWDQYAQRETFTGSGALQNRWPLFTLWGDANNHVEFVADCDDKGFRVRGKAGGTPFDQGFGSGDHVWLPGSPLLVGIGHQPPDSEPGESTLFVGASLGGLQVSLVPNGIALNFTSALTELRFRGASGGFSSEGEVCEFRWFGGEIDAQNPPQTILNDSTLPTAFSTLSFLDGP